MIKASGPLPAHGVLQQSPAVVRPLRPLLKASQPRPVGQNSGYRIMGLTIFRAARLQRTAASFDRERWLYRPHQSRAAATRRRSSDSRQQNQFQVEPLRDLPVHPYLPDRRVSCVSSQLADVFDVIDIVFQGHCSALHVGPSKRTVGSPLDSRPEQHPGVHRDSDHASPVNDGFQKVVRKLPFARNEGTAVLVASQHSTLKGLHRFADCGIGGMGDVENHSCRFHLPQKRSGCRKQATRGSSSCPMAVSADTIVREAHDAKSLFPPLMDLLGPQNWVSSPLPCQRPSPREDENSPWPVPMLPCGQRTHPRS